MFERFTDRARQAVVLAQEEARRLGHDAVGTEHVLLGLVHDGECVGARALAAYGVTLDEVRGRVGALTGASTATSSGHLPFTPGAKRTLELALREALTFRHDFIGTEHLALGLVREGEGVAAQVLTAIGVELDGLRSVVVSLHAAAEAHALPRTAPFGSRRPGVRRASVASEQGPRPASCAFCGIPSPQCGQLFTGLDDVLICERCATAIVAKLPPWARTGVTDAPMQRWSQRVDDLVAAVVPTGPPPDDEEAARAQIEAAFLNTGERTPDGRGLVNVEDGDDLGPYHDEVLERHGSIARRTTTRVDDVAFVNATEAVVWTTTLLEGRPLGPMVHREGRAVLVDGRWLVTRETIADRFALAGVHVPPRRDRPPGA